MAKKPTITTVATGYQATDTINSNTVALRDAFDNTLSLDGSTPNAMEADLDLNGNDILNVNNIYADNIIYEGTLPIVNGGTGASTASGARTNLGLGTMATETATNYLTTSSAASTYQPLDSDLTTLGGLAKTDGNFIVGNGTTWVAESGSTARTSLGLGTMATETASNYLTTATAASTYQPLDSDLTTIGGLSKTDGNFIVGNGTAWVAESGDTARTSLGVGTGDTPQFTGVLVGNSTALDTDNYAGTQITPKVQLHALNNQNSTISSTTWVNGSAGPQLAFGKSRSGTIGTNTIVNNNDVLGAVTFAGDDGSDIIIGASITSRVDGTPGLNDMPAKLVFSTTADGASTVTDHMTIGSDGVTTIDSLALTNDLAVTHGGTGASTLTGYVKGNGTSAFTASSTIPNTDISGLGTLATQSGTFSGTSSGTNTGDQNIFQTIAVSGQSNVVADSTTDTLTLVAGSNITITTDATTDSITIASTGGGGSISDGDKGDITVSSSGTVWTIDNDAVTYAKIQNVSATDKILGRSSAGAGDIEEISCTAAGRALLDDADAAAQRATLSAAGTGVSNTFTANQIVSVTDNTNAALRVTQLGTGNAILVEDETNPDATPFVISGAGVVTSGATSAPTIAGAAHRMNILGSGSYYPAAFGYTAASTLPAAVSFVKSRGADWSTRGSVIDGDRFGDIEFVGDDGSTLNSIGAIIRAAVDGTPGTGDMPGRLAFHTTADGAAIPTERMRINSKGNVNIGSAADPNYALQITGSTNITSIMVGSISGTTLTITTVTAGSLSVGDRLFIAGSGLDYNTYITALGTGTGGVGTYTINNTATLASTTIYFYASKNNTLSFVDTDTTSAANQPIGGIEWYGSDASTPGAGVKGYIATISESATPDTAMLFGTADNITDTQAVERMRITSDGKVGIGTKAPTDLLSVNGAASLQSLTLTTDLAVTHGGTGASTTYEARDNLKFPKMVTPEDFGATGSDTISGATVNQATYIQAALDHLASNGGGILYLNKWYRIATALTYGTSTTNPGSIAVVGVDPNRSGIVTTTGIDGLKFTIASNGDWNVFIQNIGLIRNSANTAGTAISIKSVAVVGDTANGNDKGHTITNCIIDNTSGSGGYWNKGISLYQCPHSLIYNNWIKGRGAIPTTKSGIGLELDVWNMGCKVFYNTIRGFQKGISVDDTNFFAYTSEGNAVTARTNSTAYTVGQEITVSSNYFCKFICTTAGTTASSLPAAYAVGDADVSVTDGTAVFLGLTFQAEGFQINNNNVQACDYGTYVNMRGTEVAWKFMGNQYDVNQIHIYLRNLNGTVISNNSLGKSNTLSATHNIMIVADDGNPSGPTLTDDNVNHVIVGNRAFGSTLEMKLDITSVTKGSTTTVNYTLASGYTQSPNNGDYIFIRNVTSMTEINEELFLVGSATASSFVLLDPEDGSNINSTSYTTFSGTGIVEYANVFATIISGSGINIHSNHCQAKKLGVYIGRNTSDISIEGITVPNGVVFQNRSTSDTVYIDTTAYTIDQTNQGILTLAGKSTNTGSPGIRLGRTDALSSTPYIDFYTYGDPNYRNARIIASGGSAALDTGTLTYKAATHSFDGNIGIGTASPTCALDVSGGISTGKSSVSSPAATDGNIFSGTYTPILTAVTNVASWTAYVTSYMRVGNVVTVAGRIAIDPTATGQTSIGMSLPIASTLGASQALGGTFAFGTDSGQVGAISGDVTNNRASFDILTNSAANRSYYFSFTYRVI